MGKTRSSTSLQTTNKWKVFPRVDLGRQSRDTCSTLDQVTKRLISPCSPSKQEGLTTDKHSCIKAYILLWTTWWRKTKRSRADLRVLRRSKRKLRSRLLIQVRIRPTPQTTQWTTMPRKGPKLNLDSWKTPSLARTKTTQAPVIWPKMQALRVASVPTAENPCEWSTAYFQT